MTQNIETGVQLYARIRENSNPTILKYPIFEEVVQSRESIEIIGDRKAGDTLILDFIIRSIIPVDYSGNNIDTIFVNTEHHLTIPIFINALRQVIKGRKIDEKVFIEDCMKKLTILNCYNSDQLKFTFMQIERLLLENVDVKLIVVDSMFTYYWMDRPDLGVISLQRYCINNTNYILNVIKDLNVVLIYKSINKDFKTDYKGFKRNYIIDTLEIKESMYKIQIIEDCIRKKQFEMEIKKNFTIIFKK